MPNLQEPSGRPRKGRGARLARRGAARARQFKIGRDAGNLLRADKIVAYFPSFERLAAAADAVVERLQSFVEFETWERRGDGTTVIRLMTSWATPESEIDTAIRPVDPALAEDAGAALRERGVHYVDVGTSGGIWGLQNGYCMMVGGERQTWMPSHTR